MAEASKEEANALVKWRLQHGETMQGRPFYDNEPFAKWCEVANFAEKSSKAGQAGQMMGVTMSPQVIEGMHHAFVNAADGAADALEAWKRLCDLLKETAQLQGCIDTPMRDTGERATHRACELGHVENLKWLIANGADIKAPTAPALELSLDGTQSLHLTPAHVAAMFGQVAALRVLEAAGANLSVHRPDGATPLDLASDQDQEEAAAWLAGRGAAATAASA